MYTSNPYMAKVRRMAVNDIRIRLMTYEQVALKYGVTKSAVWKWDQKAVKDHRVFLETQSSRPHHHPREVDTAIVARIQAIRADRSRCAPVIHAQLRQEGYQVSLASVGRILHRLGLTRKPKRASWKTQVARPVSDHLGALVEADTIHFVKRDYHRFYIYSVIDTFSRTAFACYQAHLTQDNSVAAIVGASHAFGFPLEVIQTDNGPEFQTRFLAELHHLKMKVRHTRVHKPNDNAHIERFNRTLQEECFGNKLPKQKYIAAQLKEYINYYNQERLHLSLRCNSPAHFVSKLLS